MTRSYPDTRHARPAACCACSTPLRSKGEPAVDGTRVHTGRGLCSRCWKQERYGYKPQAERPVACTRCSRSWDEVRYCGRGLCSGCYSAVRYQETHPRKRHAMPEACGSCRRPLRAKGEPRTPGTVSFAAKGMCGSCWNAARDGQTVTPRTTYTHCAGCAEPMRPRGKAEPGYVALAARGLCTRCYQAEQRTERQLIAYVLGGPA